MSADTPNLNPAVAVHMDAIFKDALVRFLEMDEKAKDHFAGCIKRAADEYARQPSSADDPSVKQAAAIVLEGAKQLTLKPTG